MADSRVAAFISAAQSMLGVPYVWGGESLAEGGFDCSGLVQWAAAKVGVSLPRTAQAQYNATQRINTSGAPPAGALVFFNPGGGEISHMGISLGNWYMIDAPRTGAKVRVESFKNRAGYVGATDPFAGTGASSIEATGSGVQAADYTAESASLISDATNTLKKVTMTVLFLGLGATVAAAGLYRGVQAQRRKAK